MQTRWIQLNEQNYDEAVRMGADLIRSGELVAFPTETVYGLGASALDGAAVSAVFTAKNRAQDNPLIVHIAQPEQALDYAEERPFYFELAHRFWPGPLTLILPAKEKSVAPQVRCGLSTVAFRIPDSETALDLIRISKHPIAAPSANLSGKPSPTEGAHVFEDMNGRIPLILDAGPCRVGIESTVLDLTSDVPRILRPGLVTPNEIASVTGEVSIHSSVLKQLEEGQTAASPGMKYKHYAPKARVTVIGGNRRIGVLQEKYDEALAQGLNPVFMVSEATAPLLNGNTVFCGKGDPVTAAHDVFSSLRACDEGGYNRIFAEGYDTSGEGLALMNRLLRAAAFDFIDTM